MRYFIGAFLIVVVVLLLFGVSGCQMSSERTLGEEDWVIEDGAFETLRFSNCGCGCTQVLDLNTTGTVRAKSSDARGTATQGTQK